MRWHHELCWATKRAPENPVENKDNTSEDFSQLYVYGLKYAAKNR
jgi:hypothetical protein